MGRKSSLTEKQWGEIETRLLAGESGTALAKEFGISYNGIKKHFGSHVKDIKDVANQLAAAEMAFKALPISSQISARTLADDLKDISENLASAASYGALTARRLATMAHVQTDKIDEVDPLTSTTTLQGIAVLTKMANSSAEIGINLLRANKETVDELNKGKGNKAPAGLGHFYGESEANA